jgi:hypothetical protein
MKPTTALVLVKLVHTVVWAVLAACVLAIPVAAHLGRLDAAMVLIVIVLVEVLVLLLNRWRCPLTGVAARYTAARADNFDIYLPAWLARHNKTIFGTLFVIGSAYTSWLAMH